MQIEKKILPKYFEKVKSGRKTFELRKDEDNIKAGDIIILREWENGEYTGRQEERMVSYVLRNCQEYGLMDGYCILSLKKSNSSKRLMNEITEKKCTKCGIVYPVDCFNKCKKNRSGLRSECRYCQKEIDRKYREANREKERIRHKEYFEKRRQDPVKRLADDSRSRIRNAYEHGNKSENSFASKITGLSPNELRKYLIETYEANYGESFDENEKVEIDHIIPISLASSEEEVIKLCHYSNLQLLKAEDNKRKGTKENFILN